MVETGHWGCGAFGGDREIKALIQMMAAAQVKIIIRNVYILYVHFLKTISCRPALTK